MSLRPTERECGHCAIKDAALKSAEDLIISMSQLVTILAAPCLEQLQTTAALLKSIRPDEAANIERQIADIKQFLADLKKEIEKGNETNT